MILDDRKEHIFLLGLALSENMDELKKKTDKDNENIETMIECLEELMHREETSGFLPIFNFRNNELAFRLLVPVMGVLGMNVFVSGTGELAKTPFQDIIDIMTPKGCKFRFDHFPFELNGKLSFGDYEFDKNASMDLIIGFMMALPLAEGDSRLILDKSYENISELADVSKYLREFGIIIENTGYTFNIKGGQMYTA